MPEMWKEFEKWKRKCCDVSAGLLPLGRYVVHVVVFEFHLFIFISWKEWKMLSTKRKYNKNAFQYNAYRPLQWPSGGGVSA